jgi:hypothetical protein
MMCSRCDGDETDSFGCACAHYKSGDEFELFRCETCMVGVTSYAFDASGYDRFYREATRRMAGSMCRQDCVKRFSVIRTC